MSDNTIVAFQKKHTRPLKAYTGTYSLVDGSQASHLLAYTGNRQRVLLTYSDLRRVVGHETALLLHFGEVALLLEGRNLPQLTPHLQEAAIGALGCWNDQDFYPVPETGFCITAMTVFAAQEIAAVEAQLLREARGEGTHWSARFWKKYQRR